MKYQQRWYRRKQLFQRRLPDSLRLWLFDETSLTARLVRCYGVAFNVQLLSQHFAVVTADEKRAMQLHGHQTGLVREVLLRRANEPVVYARTIIPSVTMQGRLRRYAHLGERPLGAMLFADRTMRRGPVEVTTGLPYNACFRQSPVVGVWGRRSVFFVSQRPILVSEYFLVEP